ncbi:MAG TPA: hypothetical protein PLJ12_12975, partial [Planctomycetota bacterium]|nr:hypothetical protein [Planctomycetota bacterium]
LEVLLDWVDTGGRLWISGVPESEWDPEPSGAEGLRPRDNTTPWDRIQAGLEEELEYSEVLAEDDAPLAMPDLADEGVVWPRRERLAPNVEWAEDWLGASDQAALLRLPYGEGVIELFAGLEAFDNHRLRDEGRAQLFEYLLAEPEAVLGVQILQGKGQGFFAMLWAHAAPAIWLAGLWVLLWVWRGLKRFGPLEEEPGWDPDGEGIGRGREFVEHLGAAARHYQRYEQQGLLWRAACRWKRASNLDPEQPPTSGWWQRMSTLQAQPPGTVSHRSSKS